MDGAPMDELPKIHSAMNGPPPPNQPAPDSGIASLSESFVRVRAEPWALQPAFVPWPTQPAGPTVSSPVVYQPTPKMFRGPTGTCAVTKAPNPLSWNGSPGPAVTARASCRCP